MEVEVRLAPICSSNVCVSCFWVCTSGKFNQSGPKKLSSVSFGEKGFIWKHLAKTLAKNKAKWSTLLFV